MPVYYNIDKQIQKEVEKMSEIHEETLDSDIENNIANESIISRYIYETTDKIIAVESQIDSKRKQLRIKYITGNTDADDIGNIRLNRSEIDTTIDGNREIIVLNQKKKELENILKYFERALQIVRNKNYAMKNIIDYRKFQNGID